MKITRIRISNYRGIAALDTDVAPSGAVIKGSNKRGKTSILKAIRACLAAQDIGEDAIRIGEDKCEIQVDLDDLSVRRAISRKGSSLTVSKDGLKASKPQTMLTELLGTSPLDPLDFYMCPPKERRARILAAIPLTITREQLASYAPVPEDFDVSGHGLEVLDRAREVFYIARKDANASAKTAKGAAERATSAASLIPADAEAPAIDVAEVELAAARAEVASVTARTNAATSAHERGAKTRAAVARMRAEADQSAEAGAESVVENFAEEKVALQADIAAKEEHIADLHRRASDASRALETQQSKLRALESAVKAAADHFLNAEALNARANDLEAAIASTIDEVDPLAATSAAERVERAAQQLERAGRAKARETAVAAMKAAQAASVNADAEAEELDAIVRRLTDEAPAALLAGSEAIPGLSLDGGEVTLDGKRLDALSGAEQMCFAIEVARRLNSRSRIILVDGVERLDAEQLEIFVAAATADNYQLIASRVTGGEIQLEAIEPDDRAGEAAAQ